MMTFNSILPTVDSFITLMELRSAPCFFKVISLNEIQTRLLIYLLANSRDAVIYKNDIMRNVWEEINLSSSSQRLWHAINELRRKLASLGLPEDFIANVHGYWLLRR
ncbi:Transcriptional regulatory protein, C terminal [Serratia fonticola]|uniref:Transcriptional regulatory protein, C terminal n=1 Tax=Serratia fonticola TaxID=47917 RepID=A0A4U9VC91_SERFO|nr:Transcriptional regulatory protein, C terminal [Serratia fonticola]